MTPRLQITARGGVLGGCGGGGGDCKEREGTFQVGFLSLSAYRIRKEREEKPPQAFRRNHLFYQELKKTEWRGKYRFIEKPG